MDISMGIEAFKNALELVKLLQSSKEGVKSKESLCEIQSSLNILNTLNLALKSENADLRKTNLLLEEEIMKFTSFAKEKRRYELVNICEGVTVFARKKIDKSKEPFHYICPNCYHDHRKSILQLSKKDFNGAHFQCQYQQCKAIFINHDDRVSYI